MLNETIIDMNNPSNLMSESIILINVTDENIKNIIIPDTVTKLEIKGNIKHYDVPEHINEFWCCESKLLYASL
jgi:predicted RNA-binding protein